jgi:hypothetical protein
MEVESGPALEADIARVLLKTEASTEAIGDDKWTKGCLEVTKVLAVESAGNKKKIGTQLTLVCSAMQLAEDNEICQNYGNSLMEHMSDDAAWNLKEMDYPLFCKSMEKVVAQHRAELAALRSGKKAPGAPVDCNACVGKFAAAGGCGCLTKKGCDVGKLIPTGCQKCGKQAAAHCA